MFNALGLTEWIAIIIGIVALMLFVFAIKSQSTINNLQQLFDLQLIQKKEENQTLVIQVKQLEYE